jgi:hypothetical protein
MASRMGSLPLGAVTTPVTMVSSVPVHLAWKHARPSHAGGMTLGIRMSGAGGGGSSASCDVRGVLHDSSSPPHSDKSSVALLMRGR